MTKKLTVAELKAILNKYDDNDVVELFSGSLDYGDGSYAYVDIGNDTIMDEEH